MASPAQLQNKLRIFLVPVARQSFVLYANPAHISDGVVKSADWAEQIPFLDRMDKYPKFQSAVQKYARISQREWNEIETAKPETWRGRFYTFTNGLMRRIDGNELFCMHLKVIPKNSDIEFHIPSQLRSSITDAENTDASPHIDGKLDVSTNSDISLIKKSKAYNHLWKLAYQRVEFHRKMFYLSVCWMPLTLAAGILPGPNLFFYYNGFRGWSHWEGWNGAQWLESYLGKCDKQETTLEMVDSPVLNDIMTAVNNDSKAALISDAQLDGLAEECDLPHVKNHMLRIRYQIETLQRNDRYKLL